MSSTSPTPPRTIGGSERLWERAVELIPGGTQTLSKAPSQFVDGVSPKFLQRGRGSHVWDVDGNEYVDWPMALGPILLGYDHPAVSEAATAQIHEGTTFSLMHPKEVEVAEALIELIPCAERVRFAKNGADATNGAVRAARAITGREHVVCSGYHGYHDWYIASTERDDGVPAANRELVHPVPFNDRSALQRTLDELTGTVAAVVLEVPAEDPEDGYLQRAIDLTHGAGAVFILDEIVTGFRYGLGGAQELFGIEPDLACFGKGMANGYPLSAVVGKREPMAAFEQIFFSMTYSGETVSLAAALATMRVLKNDPVIEHIWRVGKALRSGILELASQASFLVKLAGNAPRSSIAFSDHSGNAGDELRAIFLQECHKRGVLFGAPIFPSYSHTDDDVDVTLAAVEAAFARMEVAHSSGDYAAYLEGKIPRTVFRSHG